MTKNGHGKPSLRVTRGDLPTQLANLIGRRILNGELRPGDQLALGTVIEMAINSTARFSRLRPGGLRHSLPLHKEVYDSILAHRPDVARAHMRALIDDAQEDMRMVLERRKAEGPDQKVAKEQH